MAHKSRYEKEFLRELAKMNDNISSVVLKSQSLTQEHSDMYVVCLAHNFVFVKLSEDGLISTGAAMLFDKKKDAQSVARRAARISPASYYLVFRYGDSLRFRADFLRRKKAEYIENYGKNAMMRTKSSGKISEVVSKKPWWKRI